MKKLATHRARAIGLTTLFPAVPARLRMDSFIPQAAAHWRLQRLQLLHLLSCFAVCIDRLAAVLRVDSSFHLTAL